MSNLTPSLAILLALSTTALAADPKPRIVVLTDIAPNNVEPDDMESTIRLLAHADLFEIEALVASTGWSNTGGQEHPELIHNAIDAYEKDLPNLRKISSQDKHLADESRQSLGYWPSPDYLRSRTLLGSKKRGFSFIGKDNDSPGSNLIIKLADETDDRPLWVLVWGGGNTLAQAVWRVQQDRSPDQLATFLKKLRTYTITDQDRPQGAGRYEVSAHFWLRKDFEKDLFFIWDESAWNFQNSTGRSNWAKYADQIQNHGNLGTLYPKYKYGVEGDTPSFLYVWPNGLNDPEHPEYAGWGGTFARGITPDKITTAYTNQSGTPANAISRKYERRFYPAEFNSFAARMAWAKDGTGNRAPVAIVNNSNSIAPIHLTPAPGTPVSLDASASTDPDGDKLNYEWWILPEAGTYTQNILTTSPRTPNPLTTGPFNQNPTVTSAITPTPLTTGPLTPEIPITGINAPRASLTVPADAAGKTIHVICEITDTGTPPLTAYRRIILTPRPN